MFSNIHTNMHTFTINEPEPVGVYIVVFNRHHIIKAETISVAGGRAIFAGVKGRQRGFIFSASGRGLAPGSLLPGDAKSVSAHALTDEVLIVTA